METLSTIPGIQKRLNASGELVKCAVGKKHCCTVNTETLVLEKWYPICCEECVGGMVIKLFKLEERSSLVFKL